MTLYTNQEQKIFRKLTTPAKIQDFLETIKINFEEKGETCMSPRKVLEIGKAHCMEGAMFAAAVLQFHGKKPLVMDLRALKPDFDHVITVFQIGGYFGAITKTNHAVLRYREPIYKTARELATSFFHEYFTDNGKKTLREYSNPVDLSCFDKKSWQTSNEGLWYIPEYLDTVRHFNFVPKEYKNKLRLADPIEIGAGKLTVWKK